MEAIKCAHGPNLSAPWAQAMHPVSLIFIHNRVTAKD